MAPANSWACRYLDAVTAELEMYASRPYIRNRKPQFVYFGGGTPSYLSVDQLQHLFAGLQEHIPWDSAEEITFECEPGTLQEKKIRALRELGVTRFSLGVENFDPDILSFERSSRRAFSTAPQATTKRRAATENRRPSSVATSTRSTRPRFSPVTSVSTLAWSSACTLCARWIALR